MWTIIYFLTFHVVSVTNDSEYSSMWIVQYCSVQQLNVSAVRYQPANRAICSTMLGHLSLCLLNCHFKYCLMLVVNVTCGLVIHSQTVFEVCGLHKKYVPYWIIIPRRVYLLDVEWITIFIVIETKDFVGFRSHTFENIGQQLARNGIVLHLFCCMLVKFILTYIQREFYLTQ